MMRFSQLSFPLFFHNQPKRAARSGAPVKAPWLLLIIAFFSVSAAAQTDSAITGDIKDTNGAVLVGVQVTAKQVDTGLTRTTTSQDEGRFVFPGLPVGTYELSGSFAGF